MFLGVLGFCLVDYCTGQEGCVGGAFLGVLGFCLVDYSTGQEGCVGGASLAVAAEGLMAGDGHEPGRLALRADRPGRNQAGNSRLKHFGRHIHGGLGQSIADGQLAKAGGFVAGQVLDHAVPRVVSPRRGGLGDVAHHGHRPVERATADHAKLHRRQVLSLIHHDVAVGAN